MRLESFVWKRFEKSNRNVLNSISVFKYNCRKFAQMKKKSEERIDQSKKQHNDSLKKQKQISFKVKQTKSKTLCLASQTFSPSGSESSIASLK